MSRKRIGEIVEAKVLTDLLDCGLSVATPWGDDDAYALIADIDGKLIRIQVKASRTRHNGESFSFSCTRHIYEGVGRYKHATYEEGSIDYFATVWEGQSYLVPAEECGQEKQLRISPTRNGVKKNVHWASEYELEKVVDKLKTTEL